MAKLKNKATRWKFNPTLLKNVSLTLSCVKNLSEFIELNRNSVSDVSVVWAAIKSFIRNNAIGFGSYLHKTRLQNITNLEEQCKAIENYLKRNYSEIIENELKSKQAELNDLLRNRAEYMIHITQRKYYAEGSRLSRLLALTLKQQEAKRSIPAIKCAKQGLQQKR